MRFGVMSFCRAPYDDLSARILSAEALGFDSAWVDDDLNLPRYADFEPWSLLAALARDTTRIRLGTLVTVVTFRHPSFLASQIVTADHVSYGRVTVGIGSGGPPNTYRAYGYEEWSPRERMERLEEQVRILDSLLRGDTVGSDGPHYPVAGAQVSRPLQQPRPPIVVAAHGDRGMRLAARYADGWNSLGGQPYPHAEDPARRVSLDDAVAETRRRSERLDAACRDIGRNPDELERSVLAYRPVPDPLSSIDAFDEYVGRYREIGIDEIVFYWPTLDQLFGGMPFTAADQQRFERVVSQRMPAYRPPA